MSQSKYILLSLVLYLVPADCMQLSARATKRAAMPVLLVGYNVAPADGQMHHILKQIEKDLSFTQQFKPLVKLERSLNYASWQKQAPITILVSRKDSLSFLWQLYDGTSKKVIAQGKIADQKSDQAYAHALADAVWKELTGSEGFFSTRIAYCKESLHDNKTIKSIYIADYDGGNEQLLVDDQAINIAPRWSAGSIPLLFYSTFTDTNVKMMYLDTHCKQHAACDFDGTSMLPAFSKDGSTAIFCASNGKGTTQLYSTVKGKAKKITDNSGNNFCPTLTEDGNYVYFCSDCGLSQPSLFVYDLKVKKLDRIAQTAGCESPCYSPAHKRVVYCKQVNRTMQLFVYDTVRKTHQQLTNDADSKLSPSWSPCGCYILYACSSGPQQLCIMHVGTRQVYSLPVSGRISYPNWSPRYKDYPVFVPANR